MASTATFAETVSGSFRYVGAYHMTVRHPEGTCSPPYVPHPRGFVRCNRFRIPTTSIFEIA